MAKRKKAGKREVKAERGRNLGKNFWIGLGVVVAIVLLVIVLVIINPGEDAKNEEAEAEEEVQIEQGSREYYDVLGDECRQLEQIEVGCCITSVSVMRGKGYLLAEEGVCPEGLELDKLGCAGSYEWCR